MPNRKEIDAFLEDVSQAYGNEWTTWVKRGLFSESGLSERLRGEPFFVHGEYVVFRPVDGNLPEEVLTFLRENFDLETGEVK